ncbi:MAG: hypothetical protein IJX17_00690 [Clostridia bacterium]|nr:hypothetical protein [Clostridia bacterium]
MKKFYVCCFIILNLIFCGCSSKDIRTPNADTMEHTKAYNYTNNLKTSYVNKLNTLKNNNIIILQSNFDTKSENWSIKINKSDILKYLKSKHIKLSNISNIQTKYNDDGSLASITIAGNTISYTELKNHFGLKSNNITKIENNKSFITIYGENKNNDYFDITKAKFIY